VSAFGPGPCFACGVWRTSFKRRSHQCITYGCAEDPSKPPRPAERQRPEPVGSVRLRRVLAIASLLGGNIE
jgi:hypothetical protein